MGNIAAKKTKAYQLDEEEARHLIHRRGAIDRYKAYLKTEIPKDEEGVRRDDMLQALIEKALRERWDYLV
jgi:hypothetical protein